MKFITEKDLRDIYKNTPFTEYDPRPGERLTPGARQFLLDRGINLYDETNPVCADKGSAVNGGENCNKKNMKLHFRTTEIKMQFLLVSGELIKKDVCMSQELISLYKQFSLMESIAEGNKDVGDLPCNECTGITCENFSQCIDDCFDITEFHMQLPNGREMLIVGQLRSQLEVLGEDLRDIIADPELRRIYYAKLHQIINSLSRMICTLFGGKECQRSK